MLINKDLNKNTGKTGSYEGDPERDIPKTYLEYYNKAIRAGIFRKKFLKYEPPWKILNYYYHYQQLKTFKERITRFFIEKQ